MKQGFYLSDILGTEHLESGVLNLVEAPCGSGKSQWAFEVLAPTVRQKNRMLYLIDTINGREQFLQRDDTRHYSRKWFEQVRRGMVSFEPEDQKIVVMTYALFGVLANAYPDFGFTFEYIICDEIHNLLKFQRFNRNQDDKWCRVSQDRLEDICYLGQGIVVGITATPSILYGRFGVEIKDILPCTGFQTDELHCYQTDQIQQYTNIKAILQDVKQSGGKGICYIATITQMKEIGAIAAEHLRVGMFWSLGNKDHTMNDEQKQLRQYILDEQCLPDDIDLLIINASSETAINIRGDIEYMIIHNSNEDTKTQVRGRYRGDLPLLYVHDRNAALSPVPDKYMGRNLTKEDRDELCAYFNKTNTQGRMYKWPTIREELINYGYSIEEKRVKNKRVCMITEA